ncbi:MAG: hypothetical protein ACE5HS_08820 [bacterium]
MEFSVPQYKNYKKDFQQIAKQFSLDPNNLTVEFYTPHTQAIFIEQIKNQSIKIHIDLEDNRIISVKNLSESKNGHSDHIKNKYRKFMK